MSHIKKFEGFKNKFKENLNETVFQVENLYRVQVIVDVESKVLSSYAKKVKQNMNKDIADLMGNAQLAEELVKWVLKDGLDAEKIPASAIIGGAQGQGQAQGQVQVQPQSQDDDDMEGQVQPAAQAQSQVQAQVQPSQAQPVQVHAQAQSAASQIPAQEI